MSDLLFSRRALLEYLNEIKDPSKVRDELLKICLHDNRGLSKEAGFLQIDGYRNAQQDEEGSRR